MFCLHFPHFYFAYNFVVLQQSAPRQLFSGAISWRGTSRELSLKGVTLKDTNLHFVSVSTSDTFKTQMKQKKHSFRVTIARREKDGTQSIISFVLDHGWYEFQLKYWWLFLGFCKTQVPSRDLCCHQHGHTSCCNSWKIREKSYLIQFHVLPCN